jgi:hypothetical protein
LRQGADDHQHWHGGQRYPEQGPGDHVDDPYEQQNEGQVADGRQGGGSGEVADRLELAQGAGIGARRFRPVLQARHHRLAEKSRAQQQVGFLARVVKQPTAQVPGEVLEDHGHHHAGRQGPQGDVRLV